jgi:hypothetical protein
MNPHETARLEIVVARIAIPARKATTGMVKSRNVGSLFVTMTMASSVATATHSPMTVKMPVRIEIDGESRATKKTMYKPYADAGTCQVIRRINVMVVARTIRSDVPSRPGVGCKSCQNC